jgi:exodeoxyribonuclease V alpha subunit
VLRDLIASGIFPTVALTEIFRQADTSPIIHAAHDVYRGEVPEAPVGSDFALLEVSDEDKVADIVCNIASKLYEQRRNFQVLSPRHAGAVGVTTLNSRLRELLNPKQPTLREMKLGSDVLREDDRIMVVKNDYKLGVFNGDVGKLVSIDRKNKEVEIKIHGPPVLHVKVPFAKVPTVLRLAYAVTVHKCQGLEYDCIIMPVVNSFSHQLQRNLFYTAITRARKKVVLIGTRSAVVRAIANERESARNTLLKQRLLSIS